MDKKKIILITLIIVIVISVVIGSFAYYKITISGNIEATAGKAVFNVSGFTNESTKEIVLKEGKLIPGDSGEFTIRLDATGSDVDMYVSYSISRGTLPKNLKFYTSKDKKSVLYKNYELLDSSNKTKDVTIYWYWNPYVSDEEDAAYINKTDVTATINLEAVQISTYAMMKNGISVTSGANGGTEFWNDAYRPYIKTISFEKNINNLPTSCTGDSDLCWDVSYSSTQNKKVYAYLIDSGEDYIDDNSVSHDLYNLYIASEVPIFAPLSCKHMFYTFTNLISIDFNNNFNTSNATNMYGMFSYCRSLTSLDISSFNTSKVTNMDGMFHFCSSLTSLGLSNFNTSNVTRMGSMFYSCSSLTSLNLSSFNTSNVVDMGGIFSECSSLTSLDLSSFNTSNVTDMGYMFNRCSSLTSLDLSNFNTSKVTNMEYMFAYCPSLTSLNLSSFNTSNVTDIERMFASCSSLTSLNLISFNTSNVTNMSQMFSYCDSLTSLDLSNFNTSNVTNMSQMFSGCSSLTSLDLSSFNTSKVTNMSSMFSYCSSLTSLDLSNFNTSNVTNMNDMFQECSSLTTTINIMNAGVTSYSLMFRFAATKNGAKITVNYIADASALVDKMIATKSTNSNVVKGSQI